MRRRARCQIWEAYQGQFTDQGNMPYFVCTNKGCDPTQPMSLTLTNPSSVPSAYTMKFTYPAPAAVYNGQFRVGACVRARARVRMCVRACAVSGRVWRRRAVGGGRARTPVDEFVRAVIWGEDQDHYPYDMDATVNYNYTTAL